MIDKNDDAVYRRARIETIEQVLQALEADANERKVNGGLSEINFTLGVVNCLLIALIFGMTPQHMWILYVAESFVFLSILFSKAAKQKPMSGLLYYVDYCWVMTVLGVLVLLVLFANGYFKPLSVIVTDEFRYHLFLAAYGTAIGPLFGAMAILPFVTMVFHDVGSMTSLFVHSYPPLMFYILRWEGDIVLQAWPKTFKLSHEVVFWSKSQFIGTVFGNTLILYFAWLVPYMIWQILFGMDLPKENRGIIKKKKDDGDDAINLRLYDTVFHYNMRLGYYKICQKLWNRSDEEAKRQIKENDFEVKDFIVYMVIHVGLILISLIILGWPVCLYQQVHAFWLVVLLVVCIWRGAKRYTYYTTCVHTKVIRESFHDVIAELEIEESLSDSSSNRSQKWATGALYFIVTCVVAQLIYATTDANV